MIHCIDSLSDSCSVPSHGMLSLDKSHFFPSNSSELCQLQQAQGVALPSPQRLGYSAEESCQQHKPSANWTHLAPPLWRRYMPWGMRVKANSSPLPSQNKPGSFMGWSTSDIALCLCQILTDHSSSLHFTTTCVVNAQDHNCGFL